MHTDKARVSNEPESTFGECGAISAFFCFIKTRRLPAAVKLDGVPVGFIFLELFELHRKDLKKVKSRVAPLECSPVFTSPLWKPVSGFSLNSERLFLGIFAAQAGSRWMVGRVRTGVYLKKSSHVRIGYFYFCILAKD